MNPSKSVRHDLVALVVFAAIAFGVLGGVLIAKSRVDARAIEGIRSNSALTETTSQIEILFLRARRAEKDFLLRQDEKYLERHAGIAHELDTRCGGPAVVSVGGTGRRFAVLAGVLAGVVMPVAIGTSMAKVLPSPEAELRCSG